MMFIQRSFRQPLAAMTPLTSVITLQTLLRRMTLAARSRSRLVTPQDAAGRCPADLERHVRRIASEVVSRLRGAAPAATDSAAAAAALAPPTCLVPAIGGAQIAGGSDDFPDLGDDHSSPQADAAPPVPGGMSTMDELAIFERN